MQISTSELTVGMDVGIAHSGSWGPRSEGIYSVIKTDKVKVVLQHGDRIRTYSVRTGRELGVSEYAMTQTWLESPATQEARDTQNKKERDVRNAWKTLEAAASQKNYAAAEAALAFIKELNA